jgi:hypothetical protein
MTIFLVNFASFTMTEGAPDFHVRLLDFGGKKPDNPFWVSRCGFIHAWDLALSVARNYWQGFLLKARTGGALALTDK